MTAGDLWKTLERLFQKYGLEGGLREQLIVVEWDTEAPSELRSVTKPLYVRDRVLHLGVRNHALAQEINLRKRDLIKDLREKGYEIDDIRLQIVPPDPPAPPEEIVVEVTPEDEIWAQEALREVEVPEGLRRRMAAFLAAARARERAMLAAGARKCHSCGAVFFGEGDMCPVCHVELEESQAGVEGE
ncbi:DUF721 domain-containing protein [Candidatus Bipolaricaulota sp. J31]